MRTGDVTEQKTKWTLRPKSPVQLRETYNGFGDSLARAFELAVTPAIFGLAGYGLDRWLGIVPVLTIVFSLWALIVLLVRMGSRYSTQMRVHEASGPWARVVPPETKTP